MKLAIYTFPMMFDQTGLGCAILCEGCGEKHKERLSLSKVDTPILHVDREKCELCDAKDQSTVDKLNDRALVLDFGRSFRKIVDLRNV